MMFGQKLRNMTVFVQQTVSVWRETENLQIVEAAEVLNWNWLSDSDDQDFISLPQ